jgi:nickel transport protein
MPRLAPWWLGLTLVAGPVLGHDLWLERGGDRLTLQYGHLRGHAGHEGAARLEYAPTVVQRVLCLGADGQPRPGEVGDRYPVTVSGPCALTYVLASSGYWSKTPFGTRNQPRDELHQVVDSWVSYEGVKRLDAWGETLSAPATGDLELVPLENPLALRPGDKLHLRVTYQGRPRAGVVVAYDGSPRGESNADGLVSIRLREGGLQLIQASFSEAIDSPKAQRAVHATGLVFEVP